jgi:hypothetical protein
MSDSVLSHRTRSGDVAVSTAVAVSSTIDVRDMAAGMVYVSGVTASATISLFGSGDGVTFAALYGFDGQAATITVPASGGTSVLPDAVYPLKFLRLVADTDLGTSATVTVSLKS